MTKHTKYRWTDADDTYIRETYDVDASFLAQTIGCTTKAVYNRRATLRKMDNAQRFVHVDDMKALREIERLDRAVMAARRYPLNESEQRAKLKQFKLFETAYAQPKPTLWERIRTFFKR